MLWRLWQYNCSARLLVEYLGEIFSLLCAPTCLGLLTESQFWSRAIGKFSSRVVGMLSARVVGITSPRALYLASVGPGQEVIEEPGLAVYRTFPTCTAVRPLRQRNHS